MISPGIYGGSSFAQIWYFVLNGILATGLREIGTAVESSVGTLADYHVSSAPGAGDRDSAQVAVDLRVRDLLVESGFPVAGRY